MFSSAKALDQEKDEDDVLPQNRLEGVADDEWVSRSHFVSLCHPLPIEAQSTNEFWILFAFLCRMINVACPIPGQIVIEGLYHTLFETFILTFG